jgi:hypothetical protein
MRPSSLRCVPEQMRKIELRRRGPRPALCRKPQRVGSAAVEKIEERAQSIGVERARGHRRAQVVVASYAPAATRPMLLSSPLMAEHAGTISGSWSFVGASGGWVHWVDVPRAPFAR